VRPEFGARIALTIPSILDNEIVGGGKEIGTTQKQRGRGGERRIGEEFGARVALTVPSILDDEIVGGG
jgi:hypothetical protein